MILRKAVGSLRVERSYDVKIISLRAGRKMALMKNFVQLNHKFDSVARRNLTLLFQLSLLKFFALVFIKLLFSIEL